MTQFHFLQVAHTLRRSPEWSPATMYPAFTHQSRVIHGKGPSLLLFRQLYVASVWQNASGRTARWGPRMANQPLLVRYPLLPKSDGSCTMWNLCPRLDVEVEVLLTENEQISVQGGGNTEPCRQEMMKHACLDVLYDAILDWWVNPFIEQNACWNLSMH